MREQEIVVRRARPTDWLALKILAATRLPGGIKRTLWNLKHVKYSDLKSERHITLVATKRGFIVGAMSGQFNNIEVVRKNFEINYLISTRNHPPDMTRALISEMAARLKRAGVKSAFFTPFDRGRERVYRRMGAEVVYPQERRMRMYVEQAERNRSRSKPPNA